LTRIDGDVEGVARDACGGYGFGGHDGVADLDGRELVVAADIGFGGCGDGWRGTRGVVDDTEDGRTVELSYC
jgi:hypothetical protein